MDPHQRVNFTYSVPLDSVPDEIASLIRRANAALEAAQTALAATEEPASRCAITAEPEHNYKAVGEVVRLIESSRSTLANVDRRLQDCTALLSGWYDVVTRPPPEVPAEEPVDAATSIESAADAVAEFEQVVSEAAQNQEESARVHGSGEE